MSKAKFNSNLPAVLKALEEARQNTLEEIGEAIITDAKRRTPVDTGEAISSWDSNLQEGKIAIGNKADHAVFLELGTRHMPAQPMLQPALDSNKGQAKVVAEEQFGRLSR